MEVTGDAFELVTDIRDALEVGLRGTEKIGNELDTGGVPLITLAVEIVCDPSYRNVTYNLGRQDCYREDLPV